jgi:hypothetical protein
MTDQLAPIDPSWPPPNENGVIVVGPIDLGETPPILAGAEDH